VPTPKNNKRYKNKKNLIEGRNGEPNQSFNASISSDEGNDQGIVGNKMKKEAYDQEYKASVTGTLYVDSTNVSLSSDDDEE